MNVVFQPNVDFQRSRKFRGQQLDTHKLTHRQKVIYGLESENVNVLIQMLKKSPLLFVYTNHLQYLTKITEIKRKNQHGIYMYMYFD